MQTNNLIIQKNKKYASHHLGIPIANHHAPVNCCQPVALDDYCSEPVYGGAEGSSILPVIKSAANTKSKHKIFFALCGRTNPTKSVGMN